ncbi:MAG: class I SAM-dependent methyltransferase [Candidatus Omnitrophica bacterium]|nr:class I SAM-dependent methyltransferase [Candidatus Omnitrophota bacterium]
MPTLTLEDFASSFGTSVDDIRQTCLDLIRNKNFDYIIIAGRQRDKLITDILKKIDSDRQIIGAASRRQVWDNGWKENLDDFINSGFDLKKLVPKFIRPNQPLRYNQKYIRAVNPNFEFDFFSIFRQWLFKKYFSDSKNIYEFGCGTGFNLVALAQLYPDRNLYGTDFVTASVALVNRIAKVYRLKLKGSIFDMINPDETFRLKKSSLIFTIGAIEQLAGKFESFLQYLLRNGPDLCVHVEPTLELYDENNLADYLAIMFHRKRGYTQGFLPRLQELEKNREIEIIKVKRLYFGSLFLEGYNLIIWRPVDNGAQSKR